MTINSIYRQIIARLEPIYGIGEAKAIAWRLLEDGHGITRRTILLEPEMELMKATVDTIYAQLAELEQHRPLQYVVGFEEFLGRRFAVNESVLIPRDETAAMVLAIIAQITDHQRILDIGTGSGAIAVSLALALKDSHVDAWDISADALAVATDNAKRLGAVNVQFTQVDVLEVANDLTDGEHSGSAKAAERVFVKWDLIVSNPPYVLDSERSEMSRNVTDFEPSQALYVPDTDPLRFYRAIANFAENNLTPAGQLYFEINQKYGTQIAQMLTPNFENIEIITDLHGADRIVRCNLKDHDNL